MSSALSVTRILYPAVSHVIIEYNFLLKVSRISNYSIIVMNDGTLKVLKMQSSLMECKKSHGQIFMTMDNTRSNVQEEEEEKSTFSLSSFI